METTHDDVRLPLILGVTGHRKVDVNNPRLVEIVRGELLRLRELYPHSPFLLLAGLAEGADRLVARLAVESLGAKLIAVLPFAEEEFRKDFKSAESQAEFSKLLGSAQAVVTAPQGEEAAAVARGGEARSRQYARAGAWIVEHAQVLIAIWDGQPPRGTGGTGDVVRWRISGEVPHEFSSLKNRNVLWPKLPVRLVHIHPASFEVKRLPEGAAVTAPDSALHSVDAYNGELAKHGEAGNSSGPGLFRGRESLSEIRADSGLLKLARMFSSADTLASRHQKNDRRLILIVAALFFLAMTFSYISNYSDWQWSTLFYGFFLFVIWLVDFWASRQKIETRFFDYRALAEGLRVAVFWRLAGLPVKVSQNYLNEHLGVLSWIREALVGAEIASLPAVERDEKSFTERLGLVRELWFRDQTEYFAAKVARFNSRTRWLTRIATVSLVISALSAMCKFGEKYIKPKTALAKFMTETVTLSGPFLAAAIALEFYRQKRTLDGLLKRYSLCRDLFVRAEERLAAGRVPPADVLRQIGCEALNENADWLWIQRETPLKPKGN